MRLLLSEVLPLRTTRILGDFASDQILPRRLGDLRNTRFKLVKLSEQEWFAADHPIPITAVFIDDQATLGYDVQLRSDVAGHSWTVVRLAAPAPADAKVSASGVGELDPRTGKLLENPADLMEYVSRLAGRSETFPLLRAECAAADITLAGSLDRAQTIQAWLDEIAYSAGAMWTPEAARLYPTIESLGYVASLDRFAATGLAVDSVLDDTADILHLSYDWNDATGRPQQFIRMQASPQRFGGVGREVSLLWLRKANNAESIGRRMLQRMAGERYRVTHSTDQRQLRPCMWTRLTAHPQWPLPGAEPTPMVLEVEIDSDTKSASITSEVIASVPEIMVTAHSVALPSTISAALAVAIVDGEYVFTILDLDGKPIKDALVSVNGGPAKKADEQGRVASGIRPSVPPKKYSAAIEAPGFLPYLLDLFL